MNLLTDAWIPVLRADNTRGIIAPSQIGADAIIGIAAPRADFQGALYEFLIGLLQTAFAPEDEDEWQERWQQGPSSAELEQAFAPFANAFALYNGADNRTGEAFMQDFDLPTDANAEHIRKLLIDYFGSPELFVKPETVSGLCHCCAAAALYTLQTYSPSGGRGHRTGLRGGGPLTTLLVYKRGTEPLWRSLWLNVLEQASAAPQAFDSKIFPWMGPTLTSENDKMVYPENVHKLHSYWAMPRRIRLLRTMKQEGVCSLCGNQGTIWTQYATKSYGANYSSTWQHPLSPYKKIKNKNDNSQDLVSEKGKRGKTFYNNWLALAIGQNKEMAAAPVAWFNTSRYSILEQAEDVKPEDVSVWCYGYDMNKAKVRCWYEHEWPLAVLAPEHLKQFAQSAEIISSAAMAVANLLQKGIKDAWFGEPKKNEKQEEPKRQTKKPKNLDFVQPAFYRESETAFLQVVKKLRKAIPSNDKEKISAVFAEWREILRRWMHEIFDRYALAGPAEQLNMKRVATALNKLETDFDNDKRIKELKGN